MTELEYRIEHFEENLSRFIGKRIFLYGTGKNAQAVLETFDGRFRFAGVIAPPSEEDGDRPEGDRRRVFCGREVFTAEEAFELDPEVIIIAAQMYSAEAVYQRLEKTCRSRGVMVTDLYGTDLIGLHDDIGRQTWQDLKGWESVTEGYDTVSVSLLDTVLVRDMFRKRDPQLRPVFRDLFGALAGRGVRLIGIMSEPYPREWYEENLKRYGIDADEVFDRLIMHPHTERFFRDLKQECLPGKLLHIGGALLEDCVIPRICGVDSYRLVFFDNDALTAFMRKNADGDTDGSRAGNRTGENGEKRISAAELKKAIDESDTVSFDVFGTLLLRRVFRPEDVFALAARQVYGDPGSEKSRKYRDARGRAQYLGSFEQIREFLIETADIPEEEADALIRAEYSAEQAVIFPREETAGLPAYAASAGKKTVLTTDMYFTTDQLRKILDRCGISGYDAVYISGERGCTKAEGLFSLVREDIEKNGSDGGAFLHIGDDPAADGIFAREACWKSVVIPQMPEANRRKTLCPGSLTESLLAGTALAKWADPLRGEELPEEEKLYRYGYCAVAPMIIGWLSWFLSQEDLRSSDGMLFAARDGILPRQIYEMFRQEDDPPSFYFYTSRRAAFMTCADDPALGDLTAEIRAGGGETGFTDGAAESAESARRNYALYMKGLGLKESGRYCFVDFVAAGTTQRMLEEALPFRFRGYYFARAGAGGMADAVKTYITGGDEAEKEFLTRYMEMEYYMAAAEPSVSRIAEDGSPCFAEEIRSAEELEKLEYVRRGVIDHAEALAKLFPKGAFSEAARRGDLISPEFACRLYLAGADVPAPGRFYDDWSGKWI